MCVCVEVIGNAECGMRNEGQREFVCAFSSYTPCETGLY